MKNDMVSRRVTRFFAGLMIGMGVLSGAAIGLAATSDASTGSESPQSPSTGATVRGPLIVATPNTFAQPWVPPIHRTVIIPVDSGGQ